MEKKHPFKHILACIVGFVGMYIINLAQSWFIKLGYIIIDWLNQNTIAAIIIIVVACGSLYLWAAYFLVVYFPMFLSHWSLKIHPSKKGVRFVVTATVYIVFAAISLYAGFIGVVTTTIPFWYYGSNVALIISSILFAVFGHSELK